MKINQKKFISINRKYFSHIYHNFPTVSNYYYNGKQHQFDNDVDSYNNQIMAFLQKRWTLKQDIPPLIKIINTKKSYHKILNSQKIDKKYTPMHIDHLRYQYDNGFINKNYIFNILLEKNEIDLFKNIMDKLIMNGYVVKNDNYIDHNSIRDKINKLAEVFFNGDKLSDLEKCIEALYLREKQLKIIDLPKFLQKNLGLIITENDHKKFISIFGTLRDIKNPICVNMEDKYINEKIDFSLMLETIQKMGLSNRKLYFLLILAFSNIFLILQKVSITT